MKGVVFSIKHRDRSFRRGGSYSRVSKKSIKRFFSLYGLQFLFFIVLVFGIVLGSVVFKDCSSQVLKRLDLLFLTNIENRMELSAFDIFCSSFASDFIFIFCAFLLSFTAWGMFALPLLCAFKGFGIGLTSAYLFTQYSVTGIGFYILVILPGTVLFIFAFLLSLKEAFTQSVILSRLYFSVNCEASRLTSIRTFLYRNFAILIFTAFSAIIDMILWVLFANMFKFL